MKRKSLYSILLFIFIVVFNGCSEEPVLSTGYDVPMYIIKFKSDYVFS